MSPGIVASAITETYLANTRPSASQHFCGNGSHEGVDFDFTCHFLESKKDKLDVVYTYEAALETITTGAIWPNLRIHNVYPHVSSFCSRCNLEEDTALHCFYICPCSSDFEHEDVANTQSLIKFAQAQSDTYPCMRLRGIL